MVIEKTKSNTRFAEIEGWLLGQSLPNSAYAHQRLSKSAFDNNRRGTRWLRSSLPTRRSNYRSKMCSIVITSEIINVESSQQNQ